MHEPNTRRRRAARRAAALFAGGLMLASLPASGTDAPASEWTDASWSVSQTAAGSVQAGTVPAPRLTAECRYRPGLLGLGSRVEIYWAAPEDYTVADAELQASTSGLGSVLAPLTGFSLSGETSGSPDSYTTEVPTNLLGGLLGLGSELEIALVISDRGWTSESASIATNAGLIGGIGGSCRNLT